MIIEQLTTKNWHEFMIIRLEALELEPQAFGDSFSVLSKKKDNYWKKELSNKKQVWYGVFDNENLVGIGSIKYVKSLKFSHIAHLSGIYVTKSHRGQGIGKMLFKSRIDEAFKNDKIKKLKLIVNTSQTNAISLYKSFNFREVGKLEDEFKVGDTFYDALLMELIR